MLPSPTVEPSERLRAFAAAMPAERLPIFAFVREVAATVPEDAVVLDVGSGTAPYHELFAHTRYTTVDWKGSPHPEGRDADVVASAAAIPLPAASVDVVLLTQVLEHVPEPAVVLAEQRRLLRDGGRLVVTVPLAWELHEQPHDYFRFTGAGLRALLEAAGFTVERLDARGGALDTVAQLLRNVSWQLGSRPEDGLDDLRPAGGALLRSLADEIARLQPLAAVDVLPLGFQAEAVKPGPGDAPT
jgi:SAM-dependent methyltransferase